MRKCDFGSCYKVTTNVEKSYNNNNNKSSNGSSNGNSVNEGSNNSSITSKEEEDFLSSMIICVMSICGIAPVPPARGGGHHSSSKFVRKQDVQQAGREQQEEETQKQNQRRREISTRQNSDNLDLQITPQKISHCLIQLTPYNDDDGDSCSSLEEKIKGTETSRKSIHADLEDNKNSGGGNSPPSSHAHACG